MTEGGKHHTEDTTLYLMEGGNMGNIGLGFEW